MEKNSLIRTIYLYLFTILGLVLLTIGSIGFLNMALKTFLFTKADEQVRLNWEMPTMAPCYLSEKYKGMEVDDSNQVVLKLTEEQASEIKMLLENSENYEKKRSGVDPVSANNHRDAARNLALMIIGFPLYLYHWLIIKKEIKEKKKN